MAQKTVLPISSGLINSVLGPPEPLVRKELRNFAGPKPICNQGKKKHSDEMILQCRALRDFRGMSHKKVAELMGITLHSAQYICEYRARTLLIPTLADLPAAYRHP